MKFQEIKKKNQSYPQVWNKKRVAINKGSGKISLLKSTQYQ